MDLSEYFLFYFDFYNCWYKALFLEKCPKTILFLSFVRIITTENTLWIQDWGEKTANLTSVCRNCLLDRKARSAVCPTEWWWNEAEPKAGDQKWVLLWVNDPRGLFNMWSVMLFWCLTCFPSGFCFHELQMQRTTWNQIVGRAFQKHNNLSKECVNLVKYTGMSDFHFAPVKDILNCRCGQS